ncbi:hypothetical protein [Ilumatobacter sp.]|uniref:hypothetical protein n=1 Tax=Ilumatobacter sp. TaxID=1967498 RepID=UPI003C5E9060
MLTHETLADRPSARPLDTSEADPSRPDRATPPPQIDADHAGLVLLPLRVFLAAGWFRAAAEKLIDPEWWRGTKLREFLDAQQGSQLPYFEPIAENVIRPFPTEVAVIVVVVQLLIALSLVFGRPLRVALWFGIVLNVVFIMMGRVNPSAFYLFMEVALLYGISVGVIGRTRTRRSIRPVTTVTALLVLAATQAPFIRTIEPAHVIDDPAMMLTFLCLAAVATTLLRALAIATSASSDNLKLPFATGLTGSEVFALLRGEFPRRRTASRTHAAAAPTRWAAMKPAAAAGPMPAKVPDSVHVSDVSPSLNTSSARRDGFARGPRRGVRIDWSG